VFKVVFWLVALTVLVVMCVLAAVFTVGIHMLGLIACFVLFAFLGSAVVKAFRKG